MKLADFGLARMCASGAWCHGCFGTEHYLAPEVLEERFNELCDVWASGCVLYECLRGDLLVPDEVVAAGRAALQRFLKADIYERVVQPCGRWRQGGFALESLLRRMLRVDVRVRVSAADAFIEARPTGVCRRWSLSLEGCGADDGNTLYFEYHSHRHFSDLAHGLMDGAFEHWNETVDIETEDRSTDEKQVIMFICTKQ